MGIFGSAVTKALIRTLTSVLVKLRVPRDGDGLQLGNVESDWRI